MGDTDFVAICHVTDRAMVESVVKSYECINQIQRTSSKFVISTVNTSDTRSTISNGRRSSRRSPGSNRSLRPVRSLRRAVDTV